MKRCRISPGGWLGEGKYKDVVLDIKASEQTSEAGIQTDTHTPFDFISGSRPVIYMQNPPEPRFPLLMRAVAVAAGE